MSRLFSSCLTTLAWISVNSFNLDTTFPIIFSGPDKSYFGYTVALTRNEKGYIALAGAPRANVISIIDIREPGVLFTCDISSGSCEEFDFTSDPLNPYRRLLRDRMWLGVALDVRPDFDRSQRHRHGDIVVCAHRHYVYTDLINGMCYVLDSDRRIIKQRLKPLDNFKRWYMFDQRTAEYRSYYASGQLGMSAVYSKDGTHLIIGAPGILEATGSIVYYNISSNSAGEDIKIVKDPSAQIEPHSYFGYSVTYGRFFNSNVECYAVGAPRDETYGKVYIIKASEIANMTILQSFKGFEIGEYFGSSVLGVDLNGDPYTDLVVGAPLYAGETRCDEGRVYVYYSDGSELYFRTELIGDGKPDARFGTVVANIGDLNLDGFNDIAVGAPYEDKKGAVYIFHGSESGVIAQYSQKIEAIHIHTNLSGFGIHISRGLDIDDNGYPDILVGSYISSNAVLLRARPVIQVFQELFFNPPQIKLDKAECLYEGKNLPCVHVDACLNYTGKMAPLSLDFQCTLFEQDPSPRGFFYPYRYKNAAARRNVTLKINTETCLTLQFYFHSDIQDVITPIPINFSCELTPPTDMNATFDKTYPVFSPINITREVPFHSGCVNESNCYSDLIVEAEFRGMDNDSTITLGNITSVTIDVAVKNDGETAYAPRMLIVFPSETPIINEDFCEIMRRPVKEIIMCDLGNPLMKGRQVKYQIKLDTTRIPSHINFLKVFFKCLANTTDLNILDNASILSLEVRTVSDTGIRGFPSHHLTMYHGSEERSSTMNHIYTVRNHGPSPLKTIDIFLHVPNTILSSDRRLPFLYFVGLKVDSDSEMIVPSSCEDTVLEIGKSRTPVEYHGEIPGDGGMIIYDNKTNSSHSVKFLVKRSNVQGNHAKSSESSQPDRRSNGLSSQKKSENIVISCDSDNVECVTIRCYASPFTDVRKFAQISVAFEIDYNVLNDYFGLWYQIEFVTTGYISVPATDVIRLSHHPEITRVKTTLLHEGKPDRTVPQWLYFAGLSIGFVLLLQIVIVLVKIGFFKRKENLMLKNLEQMNSVENTQEEEDGEEEEFSQDSSDSTSLLHQ